MVSNKSIAVLPFINSSSNPDNEYFSDGITEEIILQLSKEKNLKVIARTSSFAYKNKQVDIVEIGKQLGVETLLEGSVRKFNNRVKIIVQLINAKDGTHLWVKDFEAQLDDIFELQTQLSNLIVDHIRENFGHFNIAEKETQPVPTQNVEAYEHYLKGCFLLKRKEFDDIKNAVESFKQAIDIDPRYSDAYAYLGETYLHMAGFGLMTTTEAHTLARKSVQRAIKLNPKTAIAYKVLAYIHFFHDWDWTSAIKAYNKAVDLGLPDQNEFITYYYIFIEKDYNKAIRISKQILDKDPLYIISRWQLGLCYYFAGDYNQALNAFNNALMLDPNYAEVHRWKGLVLGYLGQFTEAEASINRALELSNGQGPAHMDMLVVRILKGEKEEVIKAIEETEYLDPMDPAQLYTLLNMPDKAMYWLEKGYKDRSVMLVTLKHFWLWDNIREDKRFKAIYNKMNFEVSEVYADTKETEVSVKKETASLALLTPEEVNTYLNKLTTLMTADELFLDAELSLRELAKRIDLHPNKLSWLLNEHIGENFNGFVNTYRLENFKQKALDESNKHITLLGLAFESGFNSKTVFNAFFKKREGLSPRAWLKTKQ